MSQAIGDPDEIERFAGSLNIFLDSLNEAVANLNQSFRSLGESWQDEKRLSFEEEYNLLVQQLVSFDANASEQIPYLYALAARLRDYLQS